MKTIKLLIISLLFTIKLYGQEDCSVYSYKDLYDTCIVHIQKYEGFRGNVYKDCNGKLLIGYGHLIKDGEKYTTITKEEGVKLLRSDFKRHLNKVKEISHLDGNKLLAMTLFSYNVGIGTFMNSSVYGCIKNDLPINKHILKYGYYYNTKKELVKSSKLLKRRQFELWLYNL